MTNSNKSIFSRLRNTVDVFCLGGTFVLFSGCASIVSDSTYPVEVKSIPSGRDFKIRDKRGKIVHTGVTPEVVNLKSGAGYFTKAEYSIEIDPGLLLPIKSSFDTWYLGNIIFGGLIGMLIVDPLSGAMWKLPESVEGKIPRSMLASNPDTKPKKPKEISPAPSENSENMVFGSGFSISPTEVLTAFHVIEKAKKIYVRFPGEDWIEAKVKFRLQSLDTALLTIKKERKTFFSVLSASGLESGDEVFTIGYPVSYILGEEAKFANGFVASVSGIRDDKSLIQCSVPIQPGNSGGALVDKNGRVVGIVTSSAASIVFARTTGAFPQNVNWAVNIDYVIPLLKRRPLSNGLKEPLTRKEIISRAKKATCYIKVVE